MSEEQATAPNPDGGGGAESSEGPSRPHVSFEGEGGGGEGVEIKNEEDDGDGGKEPGVHFDDVAEDGPGSGGGGGGGGGEGGRGGRFSEGQSKCSVSIRRVRGLGGAAADEVAAVRDHFSLDAPGNVVRFRRANVRVYGKPGTQLLLEERVLVRKKKASAATEGDGEEDGWVDEEGGGAAAAAQDPGMTQEDEEREVSITVKERRTTGHGLAFLRMLYTLVSIFMGGFFFIFGLELLLFLFIDLATATGVTSVKKGDSLAFFNILLSTPVFVYSLGLLMAIVGRFVTDTWNGHTFIRTFGSWSTVLTHWVSLVFYILVPFVAMVVTLFQQQDEWLAKTLLTWWVSLMVFFVFFFCGVIFYEVDATLHLVEEKEKRKMSMLQKIKCSIVKTQTLRLSGAKEETYLCDGDTLQPTSGSFTTDPNEIPISRTVSLYSRITRWRMMRPMFKTLETPLRNWTLDETRGVQTFVTSESWSLESVFCRDRSARTIAVVRGPSKVTALQARSSFACFFIGNAIYVISVAAFLVWFGAGGRILAPVVILLLLCIIPQIRESVRLYNTYAAMTDNAHSRTGDENVRASVQTAHSTSVALYQVSESFLVTTPHTYFCWVIFALEVIFLFLWPFIGLVVSGNDAQAVLFLFLGIFCGVRHFLNPKIVLQEMGTFGELGRKHNNKPLLNKALADVNTDSEWKAKSRLSEIIATISSGPARTFWSVLYLVLVFFFALVATAGIVQGTDRSAATANEQVVLLDDWKYEANPNITYPTCQLTHSMAKWRVPGSGARGLGQEETSLIDYVFLAQLSYVEPGKDTQFLLDKWFGEGNAEENADLVNVFKAESGKQDSPVVYKFITSPVDDRVGIVSVRGTQTAFDLMADAQLWLAASLFQGLRSILPIGDAWTGILHKIVWCISVLESTSIEEVAYYKEVGAFVDYLREKNQWDIHITGHSLGGGLALIVAAQKEIQGVGLSAPNAMLSRDTFEPRGSVTATRLNEHTFNIIPNMDVVPMLDDRAINTQNIQCRTTANNFPYCHSSLRSFCEVIYSCGSMGRPVPCICHEEFGYDKPLPPDINGLSFEEACEAARMEE